MLLVNSHKYSVVQPLHSDAIDQWPAPIAGEPETETATAGKDATAAPTASPPIDVSSTLCHSHHLSTLPPSPCCSCGRRFDYYCVLQFTLLRPLRLNVVAYTVCSMLLTRACATSAGQFSFLPLATSSHYQPLRAVSQAVTEGATTAAASVADNVETATPTDAAAAHAPATAGDDNVLAESPAAAPIIGSGRW